MGAGRLTEQAELQELIELAEAARDLQYSTIQNCTTITGLSNALETLYETDLCLPLPSAQMFTRRVAEDLLNDELFEKWVRVLWPRPFMVTNAETKVVTVPDAKVDVKAWDYSAPTWSCIIATDTADAKNNTLWVESVWNNVTLRFVQEAEESKSPHSGNLIKLAKTFLTTYQKSESCAPHGPHMQSMMEPIVMSFKGIVALLSPIPFALGSKPEDVDFLVPISKKKFVDVKVASFHDLLNSSSKAFVKRLSKVQFWQTTVDCYRRVVGAEETMGHALQDFMSKFQECLSADDILKNEAAIKGWECKTWKGLRDGALDIAERDLQAILVALTLKGCCSPHCILVLPFSRSTSLDQPGVKGSVGLT